MIKEEKDFRKWLESKIKHTVGHSIWGLCTAPIPLAQMFFALLHQEFILFASQKIFQLPPYSLVQVCHICRMANGLDSIINNDNMVAFVLVILLGLRYIGLYRVIFIYIYIYDFFERQLILLPQIYLSELATNLTYTAHNLDQDMVKEIYYSCLLLHVYFFYLFCE